MNRAKNEYTQLIGIIHDGAGDNQTVARIRLAQPPWQIGQVQAEINTDSQTKIKGLIGQPLGGQVHIGDEAGIYLSWSSR